MSTRYNDGSHYENHQRSAELRNLGAHAHRVAEDRRGQQDHLTPHEQSTREREYGEQAFLRESSARHQSGASPSEEEIASHAYRLWEARGRPEGSSEEDWFTALEQLRASG